MIILEHLSVWTYLELTVYIALYRKLFSVLTSKFDHSDFRTKWSLNRGSAVGIANLIVSGLFGFGASLSGIIILYLRLNSVRNGLANNNNNSALETDNAQTEEKSTEQLGVRNDLVTRAMLASIAYFIYDLWAMFYVYTLKSRDHQEISNGKAESSETEVNKLSRFQQDLNRLSQFQKDLVSFLLGRPLMIVHHFALAFVFIPLILIRRDHEPGDILISCTFLLETSTPFVALRTVLSDLKANSSLLYMVNGLVMLVVFFFCRILVYPFFYYVYAIWRGINVFQALWGTPWYCMLGLVLSFLPQFYWFTLMFKGAMKMLKTRVKIKKTTTKAD